MVPLSSLLAFGAGCICLGITLALGALTALVRNTTEGNEGCGCMSSFFSFVVFAGAVFFFAMAVNLGLIIAI